MDFDITLCHGVILAGGQGRRMGGCDKALLPLGNKRVLDWSLAHLSPQVGHVWLSANGDPSRFSEYGLMVLADDAALGALGPLGGILMGLEAAKAAGAQMVLSLPVDMPIIPVDLVCSLWSKAQGQDGLKACYVDAGRAHYATALWPVSLSTALRAFLQSGAKPRIADFLEKISAIPVTFADSKAFANLNTPEELAMLELSLRD